MLLSVGGDREGSVPRCTTASLFTVTFRAYGLFTARFATCGGAVFVVVVVVVGLVVAVACDCKVFPMMKSRM